jgi:antitoxin component YwqK of YwqJK toxin-antitoxin module
MHYVCIENNKIVSILNYAPNVPNGVSVIDISDEAAENIKNQTHFFDVATRSVQPVSKDVLDKKQAELKNAVEREYLNSTDWMVLRHIRQKTLGITTSLTEAEYLDLEQKRNAAASRIVSV